MQRIHQGAALGFEAVAGYVVWEAWQMNYYTDLGPGPGFFPFWLGLLLGGLGLLWLAQVSRSAGRPPDGAFFAERSSAGRVGLIVAALVAVGSFMPLLGFQIVMFVFLVVLLRVLGRQARWMTVLIALAGSAGVYHVFVRYLGVPLPAAALGVLARLGL